jgi:predicted ATP-grasp superfamily ATP-dependent carboligase
MQPWLKGRMAVVGDVGGMDSPQLLIVGSSARAAAWSARRANFSPLAIDQFADTDLAECGPAIRVGDLRNESEAAAREAPRSPWMYTGPLENDPELVERISLDRTLWGNSAAVLRQVRDPWRLVAVLTESGLPSPQILAPGETATAGRWLRKPLSSGGGRGVREWVVPHRGGSPPAGRLPESILPARCYLQQFIPGMVASAAFVAGRRQTQLLGMTQQLVNVRWTGSSRFGYAGSLISSRLTQTHASQFERIGRCLADAFDLRGLFGVDAVINRQGVWPIEVNPRYTASVEVIERATGIRALALHAAACCDESSESRPAISVNLLCGKAIVYARKSIEIGQPFMDWVSETNSGRAWPRVADIPAAGQSVDAGQPIVSVLAEGVSATAVRRGLRRLAERVVRLTHAQ